MTLGMNIADLLKGCIAFSFFPTICLILIRLKTPRKTISAMIIVNLVLLGVQLLSTIIYTALYSSDVDYSIIYFLYCLPGSGLFVQLYAFFKTGSLTLLILITLPKMCYFAKNILSFIALIKAKKAEPLIQPTKIAEPTKAPLTHKTSAADIEELKRYKELLDTGAITQEEFDAKKKQLLEL